jgi:ACS family glucarate transporter-like MFS transporter
MFLISVITVIDRVNISVAAKYIMPEYDISQVQMGTIFSAFIVGYTFFFIPGGWLGDRFGPRLVLTVALLVWSLLTVLTAWAGDSFLASWFGVVGAFLCIRFLFGLGEAPAYPNANRLVANWFPLTEKALAASVSLAGAGVGAMIAPPLVAWLMVGWGWRVAFYVTGIAGVFAAAVWYSYSRDYPEEHPRVNGAELRWIRREDGSLPTRSTDSVTPWHALLSSRDLWLMIVSYFSLTYITYTYLSWFYLYVVNELHFSVQSGAWLSTIPFATIAVFSPCGGMLSDLIVKHYGLRYGRVGVAFTGFLLTALFIHFGAIATNPYAVVILLALGHGFLYMVGAVYWAIVIDIAKGCAGTASGILMTCGHVGGIVGPTLFPLLAQWFSWTVALESLAGSALVAAGVCLFLHPEKPLDVTTSPVPSPLLAPAVTASVSGGDK